MLFTGNLTESAFHHFPHVFGAGGVGGAEMDGWMDGWRDGEGKGSALGGGGGGGVVDDGPSVAAESYHHEPMGREGG